MLKSSGFFKITLEWVAMLPPDQNKCFLEKKTHCNLILHEDVIKWKHFPRYWPYVREFIDPR